MDLKKMGKGVEIAESERDKKQHTGFMAGLFRGKASFEKFSQCIPQHPILEIKGEELVQKLREFFLEKVDTDKIDLENEIPQEVFDWLSQHGYFALKLPEEYGGKNLPQQTYNRVMSAVASWCGGLTAPISAHNTIGLGYPVDHYGTPTQREKWLPIVGKNPTGFAFTEKDAGSDPASMKTFAQRIRDKDGNVTGYNLTGEKWWTTNGPKNDHEFLAPFYCVIARTVEDPRELNDPNVKPSFSAFIVPTNSTGVSIAQRCSFEGLNGICNGITRFENVYLSKQHLVGEKEGIGFRIALEALNTGRISIAGACVGVMKQALLIGKWWALERKQWGKAIGYHEAIGSGMLAPGLANAFTADAMVWFAANRVDAGLDSRMEAAACKVFASEQCWKVADDLMQMRGGRGYETASSLAKRGEAPLPVEQIHRNCRINRIFEGATEILIQWVIREGVDEFKTRGEIFFAPGNWFKKLVTAFWFAGKIIKLLVPRLSYLGHNIDPKLHTHLRFVEKNSRKLALAIILSSAKYREKMVHKQLLFARLFWIATELYGMTAACFYANECPLMGTNMKSHEPLADLADFYCREARLRIKTMFRSINENNDNTARKIAKNLLEGQYDGWLNKDIVSIVDHLKLNNK